MTHRFARTIPVWSLALVLLLGAAACGGGGGGKKKKALALAFTTLPASGSLVNASFDVVVELRDPKTAAPAVPKKPFDIALERAGGSGALSGTLVQTATGSSVTFAGLSYDAADTLVLRAAPARGKAITSTGIDFDFSLEASPADLGVVVPGANIPPVTFTVRDGLGAPVPLTGRNLDWALEDSGGTPVQSGSQLFAGTAQVLVVLGPVATEGSYRLVAGVTGSAAQAIVQLQAFGLELVLTAVPPGGTLIHAPFDVVVEVRDSVTGSPTIPSPALDVALELASGGGALSGTLAAQVNGTTSTTFTGISYDTLDTAELRVTSPRAAPVTSAPIPFEVAITASPADLGAVLPNDPIPPVTFSLTDGLGAPYTTASDLDWTLADSGATVVQSGTETFGGTDQATVSLAAIATEDTYELRAGLVGSTNEAVVPLDVSALSIVFLTLPPSGTRVNTAFDVEIEIRDSATGTPMAPSPPLDVTLEVGTGSGTLSGTLVQTVSTAQHIFTGLSYDGFDSLQIRATSARSGPALSTAIAFEVDVMASPADLGTVLPSDPIPTVDFTLLDGPGAPFAWTGDLDWELRDSSAGLVQSGAEPFGGGTTATVSLSPIALEDTYTLTGTPAGSTSQAMVPLVIQSLTLVNLPGPFVALKAGRVGLDYSDSVFDAVAGATGWGLDTGTLPAGITLNPGTGALAGVPTTPVNAEFTLYAQIGPTDAVPIRCTLPVFATDESEWIAGQDFTAPGPYTTSCITDSFSFTSTFDATVYSTNLRICYPDLGSVTPPLPLYVHHRGRGLHYLDYDVMLTRIASYGYIAVSVEDYQSFGQCPQPPAPCTGWSPAAPIPLYDQSRWELGMLSGSAFQEAAMEHMITRSNTVADLFEGWIDEENVVVGGHSRGGGSTHGTHTRAGEDFPLRGVIYYMAIDMRYFDPVLDLMNPPAYPIPAVQPRLPSLIIAAEADADVSYPFADQIIDRASGPTTQATVYGAIHTYLADAKPPEGGAMPYITRAEQQDIILNYVIAFLERWTRLDTSLEGMLYGNEDAGSTALGTQSLRNLSSSLVVDDYQDAATSQNVLGGFNTVTNITRIESKIYPNINGSSFDTLNMRHNILTFNDVTASYSTAIPAATDITGRKRLIFRIGQTSFTGYDWSTIDVRLQDGQGGSASVRIFDRSAQASTYLPDYTGIDQRVYDRFVEVQLDLTQFAGVDLADLTSLDFLFDFAVTPSAFQQIVLDDIRFE